MKKATEKIAKFTTRCKHCDELIVAGIDHMKVHHDVWVHRECYDDYRAEVDEAIADEVSHCMGDCDRHATATPLYNYTVFVKETKSYVLEITATGIQDALTQVKTEHEDAEVISIVKEEE